MSQKCKKQMLCVLDVQIDVKFYTEFGLKLVSKEFLANVIV